MTPENCPLLLFCVFNYSLTTIHYSLHLSYSLLFREFDELSDLILRLDSGLVELFDDAL